MEDFYFADMDAFSDVVIVETYVFHNLCCEVFWTFHKGLVVVLTFIWAGDVNVWQVWENMSKMLNQFFALFFGLELFPAGAKTGSVLADRFPYYIPSTAEYDESSHLAVLENLQSCYLFCCTLHLWYPKIIGLVCQFILGNGRWGRGVKVCLYVMGKGVDNLSMWFCFFYGWEVDSKFWSWLDIPEGIGCFFGVFRTVIAIICWEEGNGWDQVMSHARGDPIEDNEKDLILVCSYALFCWR